MKSLFLVLALSILLLTSACEPTEKVTVSTNTTKPVAVATNNQIPTLAQQLGIDDSINTDDKKFKELQPLGPENAMNPRLNHIINWNDEYKEMTVSYMVDCGTNIAQYTTCSLYKKDSTGKYNIVAVSDINILSSHGGGMNGWYHIIYAAQEKQAKDTIVNNLEQNCDNEFRVTGPAIGYDKIEVLSDTKMSIQTG